MAKRKILALLLMIVVCCVFIVSCPQDPNNVQDPQKPPVPSTPEPSDSDKATLSENEKYLVKNVLTSSYSKHTDEEGVTETTIQTGIESSSGDDVLKNGTFKIQMSKNSEKFYASGILNNTKMEVQFNSVTKDGVSSPSTIDDYTDESFLKIDDEYFAKNTDEFKQMAGISVTTKSEKVEKASNFVQMCMRADKVEKVVSEVTFSLVSDSITGNDVVSDIKVTSNDVVEYRTGTVDGGGENLPTQRVFGAVAVEYKEKSNESTTNKTLNIDSANIEFKKSSSESSVISGVKKGSEIKIGGKIVKLSELFDTEIKANPNFIYE